MAKLSARDVALLALQAVHTDDAYANLVLPALLDRSRLRPQDRGFATELAYGSLRREGELDHVIEVAASRPVTAIDSVPLDILRLGVYQALFMRVPSHAVANESVAQAKRQAPRTAGFVNAVLRSVLAEPADHWRSLLTESTTIVRGHPAWIAERLEAALQECGMGEEVHTLLESQNQAPRVTVCLLPGLSESFQGDARTILSPLGVTLESGHPAEDDRVARGVARIQDEGSQLAALMLTRVEPVRQGEKWLDMCAGPGGKAAVLAADAALAGATVIAVEKQHHRAALVEQSVQAVAATAPDVIEVVTADSLEFPPSSQRFDRVLLDAPCSGLGALRRRPEARWRKKEEDIPALVELQIRLLRRALELVAPGGYVAYVTCSPVVEETTGVVRAVLDELADRAHLVDSLPVLERIVGNPVPFAKRGKGVQLWTHHHHTDGMFIQILKVPTG